MGAELDLFRKFWCEKNKEITAQNNKFLPQPHMSTRDRSAVFSTDFRHV